VYQEELWVALRAARAGAAVVRQEFGVEVHADFKGDANPVTAVDRAAESQIVQMIHHHYPSDAILAEEGGGEGWGQERVWLVDPLDGTVNFLHSIPHIAVSVALWLGGRPSAAVIIDVIRREEFVAAAGSGAFSGGNPIRVSSQPELGHSLVATGFPYDRNLHAKGYGANLAAVLAKAQGVRRFGSAALDLAWVAAGRYDGYWEYGIQPWDTGAGVLLVGEAGGTVTNHRGDPYRLDDAGIITTNGLIHDALVAAVTSAVPPHLA
jgi:myo-inositol-1(or 4)-monophosphatase